MKYTGTVHPRGFSLIEIMIVMVLGAVLLSLATVTFSSYNRRTAARRAAQVFSRDLTLARSFAVRGRERVVIRFNEVASDYLITTAAGRDLAYRRLGVGGEYRLSAVDLGMPGDSLSFSSRGIRRLVGARTSSRYRDLHRGRRSLPGPIQQHGHLEGRRALTCRGAGRRGGFTLIEVIGALLIFSSGLAR